MWARMTGTRWETWLPGSGGRLKVLKWNLHSFQLLEIIKVLDSISWVRCASGNVLSLPSPCCTNYSRSPSSIPFHLPSQISCSLIDDNKWCKCAFHWQASPSRYILHVCPLLIHCNINTTTITHTNSDFRDILQCVLIRLTGLSIKKLLPTASASTATWEF